MDSPKNRPAHIAACEALNALEMDDEDEEYLAMLDILQGCSSDADEWAESVCHLTDDVHVFQPELRFAPRPEEFELGDREAYTANSVRAMNRHNATNYDEICALLDRHDRVDRVYYLAVRARSEALVAYPWLTTDDDELELDDDE